MKDWVRLFATLSAVVGALWWASVAGAFLNVLSLAVLLLTLSFLYAISKNLVALTQQMAEIKESFELEMQLTRDRFSYVMGHDPDGAHKESLHEFVHGRPESSDSRGR